MKLMKRAFCTILATVLLICGCSTVALAAKNVVVKTVKMNKASCTVDAGKTVNLSAKITPSNATDKKITWSSSDPKIAKVNQKGVVTGVKKGTVTITAKTSNGKKATCKVTVREIAVSKITLSKSAVDLVVRTKLSVKITPSNATNKTITWSSSNPKVAKVDSQGNVTATGYGTATITAKSSNGKTATCKVTVKKDLKIKHSYSIIAEKMFKMVDTMVLIVDGKTGKILSTDCYQNKSDLTVIIGLTVTKGGIKAYNKQKDYVDFRASWTTSFSVGIGKLKVNAGDVVSNTNAYRLYSNGKFEVLDQRCSDWLGLCGKYKYFKDAGY